MVAAGYLIEQQSRGAYDAHRPVFMEAQGEVYGDWVPQEWMFDQWDSGISSSGGYLPFTRIEDRQHGAFWPFFRTETDLSRIRGCGRNLGVLDSVAIGAVDALANYTFGSTGFKFHAAPAKGLEDQTPPGLVSAVQRVIDRFIDRTDFCGSFDREIHQRSREDGESLVMVNRDSDGPTADFFEPDQLCEPRLSDSDQFYSWLNDEHGVDCQDGIEPDWAFGVLTSTRSTSAPIGYHVVYDGSGNDWDFLPAGRVQHFKRNVPRCVKRGLSDFFPVAKDAKNETKLADNTVTGAALQASIPWIEEFPVGTGQSGVAAMGTNAAERQAPRARTGGGTELVNQVRYRPGTIPRLSPGRKYTAGPSAEWSDNFILVAGFVMRRIGVRWNMPEYMISGDASNANYASTMVAESPFVKAREFDQQFYGRGFHALLWKVVKLEFLAGVFAPFGLTKDQDGAWEQIKQLIDINFDAPAVATRDVLKQTQALKTQKDAGWVSDRTAASECGRDFDLEVKQGAKAAPPPPAPMIHPGFGGGIPGQHPAGGAQGDGQQQDQGTDQNAGHDQQLQDPITQLTQQHGDFPQQAFESRKVAVTKALESVETTDEAKAILKQLESYP